MTNDSIDTNAFQPDAAADERLFDSWFDPIEHAVRDRVRSFIEELIASELAMVLARPRYGRRAQDGGGGANSAGVVGHRHGSRTRTLTGTFGRTEIAVPRARLMQPDGGTTEWKSQALPAYQRRTRAAEALIASAYLAGVNTRRVRRALAALFGGAVGKDMVSRTWRKVKGDWDTWNARSLADEPIVRLILDGTVVRVRLDRQATAISLLVVIGVRADGQKVLLAAKSMGGESAEAWRAVLDDLIKRGLRQPDFLNRNRLKHVAHAPLSWSSSYGVNRTILRTPETLLSSTVSVETRRMMERSAADVLSTPPRSARCSAINLGAILAIRVARHCNQPEKPKWRSRSRKNADYTIKSAVKGIARPSYPSAGRHHHCADFVRTA